MKTNTTSIIGTVGSRIAAIIAVGFTSSAMAATVVSNTGESSAGAVYINRTDFFSYKAGGGFTVASTGSYNLDSIQIVGGLTALADNQFQMNIYANDGGTPGSVLTTLSGTNDGGGIFTFSTGASFALSASTTYYWAIELLANGDFEWSGTSSYAQSGVAGWSISDGYVYSDPGGGWSNSGSSFVPLFSVNATAVPEPSSALLGLGTISLLALRRRR